MWTAPTHHMTRHTCLYCQYNHISRHITTSRLWACQVCPAAPHVTKVVILGFQTCVGRGELPFISIVLHVIIASTTIGWHIWHASNISTDVDISSNVWWGVNLVISTVRCTVELCNVCRSRYHIWLMVVGYDTTWIDWSWTSAHVQLREADGNTESITVC